MRTGRRLSTGRLHLALLGPFRAGLGDGTTICVRRRKARALLAYLATQPGDPQPREKLVALLWGEADPDQARHNLRQTLSVLRRDLGPLGWSDGVLAGETLCLDPDLVRSDVAEFERLARSADATDLERATAVYRGDFLEGLVTEEESFESWLTSERDRLRAAAIHTLDRLLALHLGAGAMGEALLVGMRLLALDPLREDVHRVLMRLHAGEGRRALALRQYRACADVLRRELDVPPEEETTALYRALLPRPPSGVELHDAIRQHWLASDGAILRSDFREAVAGLERALAITCRAPEGRQRLAREVDLRLGFERALVPLGESDRLGRHLREAEAGARILGDRRRLGWVTVQRMSVDFLEGHAGDGVGAGLRALEIAAATGDHDLAVAARYRLAQAYYWAGDFPRSVSLASELASEQPGELSLAASVQGVLPGVHARAYLALSLVALGDFEPAREAAAEGVRLAERSGHEWSLAFARCTLGICDFQRGRLRDACDSFAVARELQRGASGEARFMLPGHVIGSAFALAGRREEGLQLVEASAREVAPRGLGPTRQGGLATLARWHLREGRVAEARAHAEEALRLARIYGQRAGEAASLHILAEVLARAEVPALAERRPGAPRAGAATVCLDALARAESLGMRPLAARCQATLGDLWERSGDLEGAQRARAAAMALRHELGWPDRW